MDYDVLIIGARVAGASLALLLGERGHRVLLIDRDRFPSDTLSTHFLSPFAVEPLRRLGVLEDVERAGFRRITRARSCIGCLLCSQADCHRNSR
jgi:2-polyprenyl-6-methoxyphenol hydroxylase-like FAD-dependent oxidoreductase